MIKKTGFTLKYKCITKIYECYVLDNEKKLTKVICNELEEEESGYTHLYLDAEDERSYSYCDYCYEPEQTDILFLSKGEYLSYLFEQYLESNSEENES